MTDEEHADGLFFSLASARLRGRALWGSIILCLAVLLPYEVVDGGPQWIFGILAELPPAAVVAAFAPTMAGIAILIARARCKRPTSLAIAILAILAAAAAIVRVGADAAAWDVLRLPTSFAERPTPAVIGLALAAAGANLSFKRHAKHVSQVLLGAALVFIVAYYAWPARGESPLMTVVRALMQIGDLPVRFQIGLLMVAGFALFPLIAVLVACIHAFVPARGEQSIAGLLATFGLPAAIGFLVYRAMLTANGSVEILSAAAGAALLAALLALIVGSVEALVDGLTARDIEMPEGLPAKRAAIVAGVAAIVVVIAQSVLALPPGKGVDWTLKPPTDDGKKLFAEDVPAWSAARAAWDQRLRQQSGASEMLRVKEAAREMAKTAKTVDAGLAAALDKLAREADALDVAGRRWYRLVAEVNEASRKGSVPFYLDPTVHIFQTKAGLLRTFRVSSYRIEAVHPVKVGSSPFATLHVRSLFGGHGHAARLGFSRDRDPYALVVLDEIEAAEKEYREAIEKDEPRCGTAFSLDADVALKKCGSVLAKLANDKLRDNLIVMTERHELQHQIDGPHLPLASQILTRMPGYHEEAQARANRELSAYVAELTSSAPPKLGLIHLIPFALIARGGAEHHVAVIVLSALSGRKVPRVDREEGVDAAELSHAIDELFALDDDTLRSRAAALWKDAFGKKLPEIAR
jgi:hypothetical protein